MRESLHFLGLLKSQFKNHVFPDVKRVKPEVSASFGLTSSGYRKWFRVLTLSFVWVDLCSSHWK